MNAGIPSLAICVQFQVAVCDQGSNQFAAHAEATVDL